MPNIHYKYGGSTAGRTIQCPAWHELAATLPAQPEGANPDADRGTLLHDCMEELIKDPDLDAKTFIGREFNGQVVTEDDVHEALLPAITVYEDLAEEYNFQLELPEIEVKASEDTGGTSDVIACNEDAVFIIDWKFGFYGVEAEENPQALFYAMCAVIDPRTSELFKRRKKLVLVIIQPTTDEGFSLWETDVEYLKKFADSYSKAKRNQDINKPKTGGYCKFCPAMALCPAKNGQARRALMLDPNTDQADVLAEALAMADEVEQWAKSVKKLAHEQMEQGLQIKGFKLVDKRAMRKWSDEEAVLDMVRKARKLKLDEGVDMKLKSPAQLEKVCKKKGIDFDKYAAYIESVSSGTTLTTQSDKRPAAVNAASMLAAINANS